MVFIRRRLVLTLLGVVVLGLFCESGLNAQVAGRNVVVGSKDVPVGHELLEFSLSVQEATLRLKGLRYYPYQCESTESCPEIWFPCGARPGQVPSVLMVVRERTSIGVELLDGRSAILATCEFDSIPKGPFWLSLENASEISEATSYRLRIGDRVVGAGSYSELVLGR